MITHPNIVEHKEIFETQKDIRIVMEQVKGGSLENHLNNFKMEPEECIRIMYQLITAIKYMHSSGIVHRDIKPDNILIVKDNDDSVLKIKITDFGLSKIITPS